MLLIELLRKDLEQEIEVTGKFLKLVPPDKFDWKPHTKSMSIRQLATHIAEIPGWIYEGMVTEELDMAKTPYNPKIVKTNDELVGIYEDAVTKAKSVLVEENEANLDGRWVMRNGEQIWIDMSKTEVIRHAMCQLIHHRGQLSVYLRLLDIPIPGAYGPSADEKM
jgi:uncharacterized damage-inducible protein DinB